MAQEDAEPQLPIAISAIDNKYLLFDIQAISWLRKHHHICGVYIGTLPQNPSQNVFMGLPMEIMPEEAQLLIELGLGYILDDARAHDAALSKANRSRVIQYTSEAADQAVEISQEKAREKETDRKRALKKVKARLAKKNSGSTAADEPAHESLAPEDDDTTESFFSLPADVRSSTPQGSAFTSSNPPTNPDVSITPTTSAVLLPNERPPPSEQRLLPGLTASSYNLYRHLHSTKSYYMTPGLRFGCQFCVYPGDPLRFHSHFLAVDVDWDEEIDLMNLVGGGRLGTGVKKGYLFGGKNPTLGKEDMRTFSVEWAAI